MACAVTVYFVAYAVRVPVKLPVPVICTSPVSAFTTVTVHLLLPSLKTLPSAPVKTTDLIEDNVPSVFVFNVPSLFSFLTVTVAVPDEIGRAHV